MPKSTRQRAHPQGTNARNRMVLRPAWGVARAARVPRLRRHRCVITDVLNEYRGLTPRYAVLQCAA